MIFLSHNWKDKDVVEPIAVRLKEVYGEENVFYDSWSIKPGENIIGKMSEEIEKCKYFFFFISNNSLNSSMVDLEWQSALFKSAKDGIKFIPIKIDNCYPPQILISTVYIDMYTYGIENTLRDMFDLINETDSKSYNKVFNNLICKVKKIENYKFEISIEAIKLIEPNSGFAFSFTNPLDDIEVNVTSDMMTQNSEGTIQFGNIKCSRITRVLTPEFPYQAVIYSKSNSEILNFNIWHQISKDRIVPIKMIEM